MTNLHRIVLLTDSIDIHLEHEKKKVSTKVICSSLMWAYESISKKQEYISNLV